MQAFVSVVALLAAVASAQQYNAINIPGGQTTLDIVPGANTITWGMPSSGTVTIKLQQCCGVTTPQDGVVLASGVPASAETASFTLAANQVVAGQAYNIEIVDDSGTQASNFSPSFTVSGATGTATASGSSSGTMTMTMTGSSTVSGSSTMSGSSTSGTNTASMTSKTSSKTSSASATSATTSNTSAPNSANKITGAQGGLFAFMAAVIAIL